MRERIQSVLDTAGSSLTPSQREALEDLETTFSEYERAYLQTVECIRDQGLDVVGPYTENNGRYLSYGFGGADPNGDAACRREYLGYIDQLWIDGQVPTGREAERIRDEYEACIRDAGLIPQDDFALAQLDRFVAESSHRPEWISNPSLDACVRQFSIGIFAQDP